MRNKEAANKLAKELDESNDPKPIIVKLLGLMDVNDYELTETCQSILLNYFDSIRKSGQLQSISDMVRALRIEFGDGTIAADFLDTAYKAYELILDEAYKKTIRTMTGSYKTDGSIMCCPECKSTNVYEGENSMYEFTDMNCRDCGYQHLADDYQIEDWYRQ